MRSTSRSLFAALLVVLGSIPSATADSPSRFHLTKMAQSHFPWTVEQGLAVQDHWKEALDVRGGKNDPAKQPLSNPSVQSSWNAGSGKVRKRMLVVVYLLCSAALSFFQLSMMGQELALTGWVTTGLLLQPKTTVTLFWFTGLYREYIGGRTGIFLFDAVLCASLVDLDCINRAIRKQKLEMVFLLWCLIFEILSAFQLPMMGQVLALTGSLTTGLLLQPKKYVTWFIFTGIYHGYDGRRTDVFWYAAVLCVIRAVINRLQRVEK